MSSFANGNLTDRNNIADHIVAALAPCQYEGLLSRRATEEVCDSEGASLPADMTSLFGFECRLGDEEPVADFLLRIGPEAEEWPILERQAAGHDSKTWRRIGALLAERGKPGSPLVEMLQNIWLEYDLVSPMHPTSDPSVFFGTEKLTRQAETGWAAEVAATLRGEPLTDASLKAINDLVAVLPEGARVFQVGIMCSRPRSPLRLCVIGQQFSEISAFLEAAHWPGELARVAETLERFTPVIDTAAVDLDILDDGRLSPKLGIELYQKFNEELGPRMTEFVRRLNDDNLCTLEKAAGLFAWSGITHERLYRNLWPAALIVRRALRDSGESSTFRRWLHHVKIVLEPGAPPSAKAYLGVSHVFLADSVIREALQRATSTSETPS
jgi:hypothetical protein